MAEEAREYAWQWDASRGREVYRRVRTEEPPKRGWGPRIHFARDDCDVISQVDGRRYTSKAALRASYRKAGVVEVGNEVDYVTKQPAPPEPVGVADSVEKALAAAGIN